MCIPWSKAKWEPGIFVNFSYPDTDYLSIPSFQVASCCLYLYCFSPPKWCTVYFPEVISAPHQAILFHGPKSDIFTIASNVSRFQCWVAVLVIADIIPPSHRDRNELGNKYRFYMIINLVVQVFGLSVFVLIDGVQSDISLHYYYYCLSPFKSLYKKVML